MEAQSLASFDTEYSADSIEFCPNPGFEDVFVCGTYQLLKPEETVKPEPEDDDSDSDAEVITPPAPRVGRLYLFNLDGEAPVEKQRIETAAILDAKWSRTSTSPELYLADAKGGLTHYSYSGSLTQLQRLEVAEEKTLVLSLDPSPHGIITSLSNGHLAHVVHGEGGEMEVSASWQAHDFEPWITAWEGETVWSGGDDCKLKRWDLRAQFSTFVNKDFGGGVTTIAPSPHQEHTLAVGSYDGFLRIFDTRQPKVPVTEVECPGGIWRTRWHPSPERKNDILNACMQGGFAVVRLGEEGEVVKTFPGTLGYGADWCRRDEGEESLVATCSFYDHIMHVWKA